MKYPHTEHVTENKFVNKLLLSLMKKFYMPTSRKKKKEFLSRH